MKTILGQERVLEKSEAFRGRLLISLKYAFWVDVIITMVLTVVVTDNLIPQEVLKEFSLLMHGIGNPAPWTNASIHYRPFMPAIYELTCMAMALSFGIGLFYPGYCVELNKLRDSSVLQRGFGFILLVGIFIYFLNGGPGSNIYLTESELNKYPITASLFNHITQVLFFEYLLLSVGRQTGIVLISIVRDVIYLESSQVNNMSSRKVILMTPREKDWLYFWITVLGPFLAIIFVIAALAFIATGHGSPVTYAVSLLITVFGYRSCLKHRRNNSGTSVVQRKND